VNAAERLHAAYGGARRLDALCRHLAGLLPEGATVLDVGCGDGALDERIAAARRDVLISGLDVLVRPDARIAVAAFDGRTIPHPDRSFDAVILVDVLHHCEDPEALLAEAVRVARRCVLVKDHLASGPLSRALLRFMDDVGNRRFGVALPHNYWEESRWRAAFERLGVSAEAWIRDLALYPGPLDWIFGGSLHFVVRLGVRPE
jgi:SAM-dependent methyltransferase